VPGGMSKDRNLNERCVRAGIIVLVIGSIWHLEHHTVHFYSVMLCTGGLSNISYLAFHLGMNTNHDSKHNNYSPEIIIFWDVTL
jgi:hypothetical protein